MTTRYPLPHELPIYKELCLDAHAKTKSIESVVDKYNPRLKGTANEKYSQIIGNSTVIHTSNFSTSAESKKKSPKSKYKLSKRQLKMMGLLDIKKDGMTYKDAQELHELWKGYIYTLFKDTETIEQKSHIMISADVHGAYIKVIQSRNPSCKNLCGLIILETQNTFNIVTENNQHRILSKSDCIFHLIIDNYVFVIYGQHFCYRTAQRSKQKFGNKTTISIV